jgi:uncharacterized protein
MNISSLNIVKHVKQDAVRNAKKLKGKLKQNASIFICESSGQSVKEGHAMTGKFLVSSITEGYRFELKAANGEVILSSQPYLSHASCIKGIESIKTNAPIAPVEDQTVKEFAAEKNPKFEMYRYRNGDYRFRLLARNGELIGSGERYKSKVGCQNGIDSIKRNAAEALIVEEAGQ